MNNDKRLLIYFDSYYLADYFTYVADFLATQTDINITVAAPFAINSKTFATQIIATKALHKLDCPVVWTTSELLHYLPNHITKIATQHHAGYGETSFIPSVAVLEHADYLFCASYSPAKPIHSLSFANLLPGLKRPALSILAVGYPKLDKLVEASSLCNKNDKTLIIALTTMSDSNFDVEKVLNQVLEQLLQQTDYHIIVRPFPGDIQHRCFQQLKKQNTQQNRLELSEGSYIPAFEQASLMFMLGRDDATTAYTFAYSQNAPVIFINPNNHSSERDIGYQASTPEEAIALAVDISENHTATIQRLEASKHKDIAYFNRSLQRIATAINDIFAGQQPTDSYQYQFPTVTAAITDSFKAMQTLHPIVTVNSKNHGCTYIIANYIYHFLSKQLSDDEQNQILNFVLEHRSWFSAVNFLELMDKLCKRLANNVFAPFKTNICKALKQVISKNQNLAGDHLALALGVFQKLQDQQSSAQCYERITYSSSPAALLNLLRYEKQTNRAFTSAFLEQYLNCYWHLPLLIKAAKNSPYYLFGDGESTGLILAYLQSKGLTVPRAIVVSTPAASTFSGLPLIAPSELKSDNYPILIVSPGGYQNIYESLTQRHIPSERIQKIGR